MGIVVAATHLQLGTPVAVKFLLPEVLGKHEVVQRFLREAQAAVRLKSEHVARVIDVGSLETGAPYMVLEYLEGTDLSQFPRSELSTGVLVDLTLQACEALHEAHKHRHRPSRHQDPGETCDDGNTTSGDGCSSTCQIEPGHSCDTSVTPSVCS